MDTDRLAPPTDEQVFNAPVGVLPVETLPAVLHDGVVCPVCHATLAREREVTHALVHAAELSPADPLCSRHLWLAIRAGLPAQALVPAVQACVAELEVPPRRGRSGKERGTCPVCVALEEVELGSFPSDITRLCLPHLVLGLHCGKAAAPEELAEAFVVAGRELESELSEQIRKADYRFRDEPRGAERDSWLRALARIAGAPGIRWRYGRTHASGQGDAP